MGTITPILDTLLPQVIGRAGDLSRAGARTSDSPLSALRPISDEMPSPVRRQASYPGRGAIEGAQGPIRGAGSSVGTNLARGDAAPTSQSSAGIANANTSTQLHLSRGADVLTRFLGPFTQTPSSLQATTPLTAPGMTPQADSLAAALGHQVTASGLFYESHLAQWVRGRYPSARLMNEPQARLAAALLGRGGQSGSTGDSANASNSGSADQPNASTTMDPRLATIVRQQAELLATGVFYWQGQAWPNVPMRWQIQEHNENDNPTNDADETTHRTALSLELDSLGSFEARLSVGNGQVHIAAWAENGIGRELAASDLETLRQRLRRAGFAEPSVELLTEAQS